MKINLLEDFIKQESSSGIVLIFVTILALIFANTGLSPLYQAFLNIPVAVQLGALSIDKPLLLWINDGLMAIFFLLVGLEVKREIIEGNLSTMKQAILPIIAAVGGVAIPAATYLAFTYDNPDTAAGWAIPTATDIAFALGVLALLGKRVPLSLKVFLMALAIIDDLAAIVIIALFYTSELSTLSISVASASLVILILMNRMHVARKSAYFVVGAVLWVSVLKSGVHATLAGVALAFTIPFFAKNEDGEKFSPSNEIEHDLHYWVAFFILPLFAFVNAGVDVTKISMEEMAGPVPMGIMLGLFFGKQIGVFGFSWLAIKLKIAELPEGATWLSFYGVCVLTGIGFTMSLFISSLAFSDPTMFAYTDKLAILIASIASAIFGFLLIKAAKPKAVDSTLTSTKEPAVKS